MFNYWQQPRPIRWFIRQFIPKRDEWEITVRKHEHGDWVFDIPPFVKDEALTGGTESIIDEYFMQFNDGCVPGTGDTIIMRVSVKKPDFYHAVCEKFDECVSGFGRVFIERNTQMVGWLCGMETFMFGIEPERIYITFINTCTDDEFFKFITGRDINTI